MTSSRTSPLSRTRIRLAAIFTAPFGGGFSIALVSDVVFEAPQEKRPELPLLRRDAAQGIPSEQTLHKPVHEILCVRRLVALGPQPYEQGFAVLSEQALQSCFGL